MSIVPINVSSRAEAAVARANRAVVRIMFYFWSGMLGYEINYGDLVIDETRNCHLKKGVDS
jgi:hypothetical protein